MLVRKGQTRFTAFDDQILSLYARGMSTRDIASMFQEMYGADISHSLISKVTETVLEDVHAWQSRRLDVMCILLCIWIASWLKSIRINTSSIKPFVIPVKASGADKSAIGLPPKYM